MKHRNRGIAVTVLCLCFVLPLIAAPASPWTSPFARFLAYVESKLAPPWPAEQSKLSPPIPTPEGRLSPPTGAQGRLSPPIPFAPPSDTTAVTVAPTPP